MSQDKTHGERLATLETEMKGVKDTQADHGKRLAEYDKMTAKTGGIFLGIMALGAALGGHYDKLKKLAGDILP